MLKTFEPVSSTVLAIAAANTSTEITTLAGSDNIIRLYNATSAAVQVRWGTSAQTAVATDLCLAPGAVESFFKANATRLAAISTGTGNIYITTGNGSL
jgi:hypothetical protein